MAAGRRLIAVVCLLAAGLFVQSCASLRTVNNAQRAEVVRAAKDMLDTKYEFGKQDPGSGFDCSGLAQYAYKQAGIKIPRTTAAQYASSKHISKDELKEADLVFFSTNGPGASHVGIYLGKGRFIHAPSEGKKVQSVEMNNPYWKANFFGAGTYFK